MTNLDKILECLEFISPKASCDDHLSELSGVKPRQQVRQIAEKLKGRDLILRQQGVCDFHESNRPLLVSSYCVSPEIVLEDFPIERCQNQLDFFLKRYLASLRSTQPPNSLAGLISALAEEGDLPRHQANMMHTIRGLRNVFVHEHLALGQREVAIASNAWGIISDWGASTVPDLWRLATR